MPVKADDISDLLKQLRRECKLTQVQLANEVHLSPTTIYRYESGKNPDTEALFALFQFAEKADAKAISNVLRNILASRMVVSSPEQDFNLIFEEQPGRGPMGDRVFKALAQLNEREQIQVLAYLEFMKGNTNTTEGKMMDVMLEMWIDRIKNGADVRPSRSNLLFNKLGSD
jgi:DNA-binding XRE family transcriptional regulator